MVAKTQRTDSIKLGVALFYGADNETWTVAPGVVLLSQFSDAVASDSFANNTLINHGDIYALSANIGVNFYHGNGTVLNDAGAQIFGGYDGVSVNGGGNGIVNNFGKIVGIQDAGIWLGPTTIDDIANNHGSIFSHVYAIYDNSQFAGGMIDNYEAIRSDGIAIYLNTATGLLTNITNAAGAVITGPADALYANQGMFRLTNHGTVVGEVFDFAGLHDVVTNPGTIKGPVDLNGGNDVFNGAGGRSGPVYGGDGNDRLIGGISADQLHGDNGNDRLTGGPGADKFFFDTALNALTNVDTITDLTPAEHDKTVLSETYFTGLGAHGPLAAAHFHINHAVNGNPEIIYTPGNGFLYFDANGNLPGGMTQFATLSTHPVIHSTDFIVAA